MAGDEEAQLKGLGKIFNSVTINGRANVAKATYASVALLAVWFWARPKKVKPPPEVKPACKPQLNQCGCSP